MAIAWKDYCNALTPLIQKFGAIHYPQDAIQKGYYYWKSKDQADLMDEINRAISFNQPMALIPAQDQSKRPDRKYWQADTYHQTEGFLETFLEKNKVSSVLELLDKEREKHRK